jgi:hypothetical protein
VTSTPALHGRQTPAHSDIAPRATDNRLDRIEQLKELRCSLGDALARDDVAQIADGYLAVAQLLRRERRFAAAVQQLEEGIDLLTAGEMIAEHRPAAVSRLTDACSRSRSGSGTRTSARFARRASPGERRGWARRRRPRHA